MELERPALEREDPVGNDRVHMDVQIDLRPESLNLNDALLS